MGLFSMHNHPSSTHPYDLEHVLLRLSSHPDDTLCLGDFVTGCFVSGSSGSGKTSGPGATIARAFLRAGYGGLVLTTKLGECEQWRRWCEQTGRLGDFVVMDDSTHYRFNFLEYENKRAGRGAGLTANLAALFLTVMEATDSGRANSHDPFWRQAVKQLVKNCIDLIKAADEELSITNIKRLVTSSPSYPEEVYEERWMESYCWECLKKADSKKLDADQRIDLNEVQRYWTTEVPSQDSKTRANVFQSFSVMADSFLRGLFRLLFCTSVNITPELSIDGKIIVLDFPCKTYDDVGRNVQVLFKAAWQKAMERRDISIQNRPVFLFADEFQEFATSSDAMFQATARSSRVCSVCLTQSIPGLYDRMGGTNGKYAADSLLSNLSIKIMCGSGCPETNTWAENLINKRWRYRGQSSISYNSQLQRPKKLFAGPDKPQISGSVSPSLESQVLATRFTQLKSGGVRNNWMVDGLIVQSSRAWRYTRTNYIPVTFLQEF